MNDKYLFEDKYFAISKEGVHFLRNRFNYETVKYNELDSLKISKGKSINNSILILILGILIVIGVLFYTWNLFTDLERNKFYVTEFAIIGVVIFTGFYFVYIGLRKVDGLEVIYSGKREFLPLNEIKKSGRYDNLIDLLEKNSNQKFKSDRSN